MSYTRRGYTPELRARPAVPGKGHPDPVNTIGQPLETTIALSHLIFGGVLDGYPGLKLVAAHGGGYLPTYRPLRPRLGGAARSGRAGQNETGRAPEADLVRHCRLRHDRASSPHRPGRCVTGRCRYDMGSYDVHALVDGTPRLSDEERAAVLGGNAAALIGWPTAGA